MIMENIGRNIQVVRWSYRSVVDNSCLLGVLALKVKTFPYPEMSVYTYLLTPWCRVLLEKLTGLQLVKELPAFHGTRRFITVLTSVRHMSLSWASPIQSIYTHPTS